MRDELGLQNLSMNDFSSSLNRVAKAPVAEQGLGNWFQTGVKHYSANVDEFLDTHAGGVQDALGSAGESLFGFFGADRSIGRQVGEEALRGTVDFLPAIAGLALAPFTGGASAAVGFGGLAASGAMGAANAYEKTGSQGQTLLAGLLPLLGGPVSRVGSAMGLSALRNTLGTKGLGLRLGGTETVEQLSRRVGDEVINATQTTLKAANPIDRLVGAASGEAAINTLASTASSVVNFAEGKGWENPFSKEAILENLVDPTLVFGINELVRPSVISQNTVIHQAERSRERNAVNEARAKEIADSAPTNSGITRAGIEAQYMQHLAALENIQDKDERSAMKTLIEETRREALESMQKYESSNVPTIFGEVLDDKLSALKTIPVTETVQENGELVEKEVTAEEVAEGDEIWNWGDSGLSGPGFVRAKRLEQRPEPKSEEEARELLEDANVVRSELGEPLVDDADLRERVEEMQEKGVSLEEGVEKALAAVKSETVAKRKATSGMRLTPEQREKLEQRRRERAATAGAEAENTGRPRKAAIEAGEEDYMDFVAARNELAVRSGDESVEQEMKLVNSAMMQDVGPNERQRRLLNIAKQHKRWLEKKEKFELVLDGKPATTTSQQMQVLKNMLSTANKWGQESYQKGQIQRVKIATDSMVNRRYASEAEAQAAIEKLQRETRDPKTKEPTLLMWPRKYNKSDKGEYIIEWKGKEVGGEYIAGSREVRVANVLVDPVEAKDVDTKQAVKARDEAIVEQIEEILGEKLGDTKVAAEVLDNFDEFLRFQQTHPDLAKGALRRLLGLAEEYKFTDAEEFDRYDGEGNPIAEDEDAVNWENFEEEFDGEGGIAYPDRSDQLRFFPQTAAFNDVDHPFTSRRLVTPKDLVTRVLRRAGMDERAIERLHPTIEKLYDLLGADDIRFNEILSGDVAGAATIRGKVRELYLGPDGLKGLSDTDKADRLAIEFGHELAHAVEHLYNEGVLSDRQSERMLDLKAWTESADADERRLALEILGESLPKRVRDSSVMQDILASADNPEELRANLMSLQAMSTAVKPDGVVMKLLPRPVRRMMETVTDISRSVVGAMRGTANVLTLFKARTNVRSHLENLTKLVENQQAEQARTREFFAEAQKMASAGVGMDNVLSFWGGKKQTNSDFESVLPEDTRSGAVKFFDNFALNLNNLAEMVPALRGAATALFDYPGIAKADMKKVVGELTGAVDASGAPVFETVYESDGKTVKYTAYENKLHWELARDDKAVWEPLSEWMRRQQEPWKDEEGNVIEGRELSFGDLEKEYPELHRRINALPQKKKEAVVQMRHKMTKAMQQLSYGVATRMVEDTNVAMLKSVIASMDSTLFDKAPGLAEMTYKALKQLGTAGQEREGEVLLGKVASHFDSIGFDKVVTLARSGIQEQTALISEFTSRPWFFSERRFGEHNLHWTHKDGKTGSISSDNLADLRKKEQELRQRFGADISFTDQKGRAGVPGMVAADAWIEKMQEMDERRRNALSMLDLSDEQMQTLSSHFSYAAEFTRTLKAQEVLSTGSRRGLKEGRENLNMVENQMAYFNAVIKMLHKRKFNQELAYHLTNPKVNDPKIRHYRDQFLSMVDNFMTPDTKVGNAVSTQIAGYFLGLNFSSHVVELAQPLFSYVPEMQLHGLSYVGSMKLINEAQKAVSQFTFSQIPSSLKRKLKGNVPMKALQGRDDNNYWDDPAIVDLMNFAANRGKISMTHAADIVDADLGETTDLSGMTGRNGRPRTLVGKMMRPAQLFAESSLKLYQQATQYNARVGLYTGYKLGLKKGMNHQEAKEFALVFADTVTFGGGKANRSNLPYKGKEEFRTAGQAFMALQGFQNGMLGMMRRYAELGWNQRDATPEQKKKARKALTTIVSTQFAGAGLIGMPFAGAAMKALEAATGVEIEREMREGLAGLFEDDEEDGGLFSDIVMHGAANAIAGKILPGAPDIGSRFALSGILGVNSYDGWSLSSLAGPGGQIVENAAKGFQTIARDRNMGQGLETIAPVAFKKAIEMVRNEGEFRDRAGDKLVNATFGEQLSYAIGFTPQRVRQMKNYERLHRNHEEHDRRKVTAERNELARLYELDPIVAQAELRKIAKKAPKVQALLSVGDMEGAEIEYQRALKENAQAVAERVENRQFARDPSREGTFRGTYGSDSLMAAMGQRGTATETARLQLRANVMARLGVQPTVQPRAMQRAQLIDHLITEKGIARPQATLLADRLLAQR